MAAFLALDVLEGRGNTAVAAGWLSRARDLLKSHPQSVWLSVVDGIEGALAGVYERDFPRAAALLHSAADSARTVGRFDAALLSEAQLGLVLVLSGAVSDGLRLLDGATTAAVSGRSATRRARSPCVVC